MTNNRYFLLVSILFSLALAETTFAIPAFPGAEGFGANALGGRGGIVIKVTNLNDNGPGSFRAAVTASGPRIVVFEVSGIINLESPITISNDYLTIAGQTSPGGVLITGYQTRVRASHIIVRFMRFRVGSHRISSGANAESLDSFNIWGVNSTTEYKSDIIVDHCSIGWGVDDNFSTAYNLRNVTISNNIIHEGLSNAGHPKGEHSKGLFIWGKYSPDLNISLHHNFIAHNTDRNPLINNGTGNLVVDAVNNVAYNWKGGLSPATSSNGVKINWVHNYSKGGNQSNIGSYYEVTHKDSGTPVPNIYVLGNIGGTRLKQGGSEWTVGVSYLYQLQDEAWRTMTPWPTGSSQITTTQMSAAYALEVVANAGATRPFRDSADTKVANDFANGTGSIIDNVRFPEDFPKYQNLPAPADNDDDGMADSWEADNGLNVSVDDSAADADGDGYTNIEEYLHYLAGSVALIRPAPPASLVVD